MDAELVLETPFLFRDAGGEWHEIDPGTGVSLAPVLALFGQTLTGVSAAAEFRRRREGVDVREHGALVIDFQDGAGLWIGPDPRFVSWHLARHGVAPITVGPGGEDDWEL